MTYSQTLDYLYAQLPMYQRIGAAAYKKDLTNTLALMQVLGNPHQKIRTIHVGGTNGKGSTSHFLAAICQAAGLKVGLYTSPHYRDFRERVKINGQLIPKKNVQNFVKQNITHFDTIQPSFFEWTVALAFDYFAKEAVDIAIIEVGLGGRLDSTNVISPAVSVITNISFDHMDMLGDTLPEIAFEKAGIIKQNTPIIIGETQSETSPVFKEKAKSVGAPIVFADQNYRIEVVQSTIDRLFFDIYKGEKKVFEHLELDAQGDFQQKNIATTLQTIDILRGGHILDISDAAIRQGLASVRTATNFIGRWHILSQQPLILCDSAHNEGGLNLVLPQLKTLNINNLHIVLGFVKDKDLAKALPNFPKNAQYYFAKANIPRGLEAPVLATEAAKYGLKGKTYMSVKRALNAAKRAAQPNDAIYVGGSIFVVAEVI